MRACHYLIFTALLLMPACDEPASGPAASALPADEWRTFEGTWSAAGTRQTLHMGSDHRAAVFELTGSLLLTGTERPAVGFQARAIGFSDSRAGMQGRCIWTDERGDEVYSELTGEGTAAKNRIQGTFLGGTGRYAGATGTYEFSWQRVMESEDGSIQGRAVGLKGRVRAGPGAGGAAK